MAAVQVAWFEKKGKLVASNVKLVRLGPNSVNPNDMVLVDDRQCVSYLYGSPAHRSLHLYNADYEWFDYTWFLGLLSE